MKDILLCFLLLVEHAQANILHVSNLPWSCWRIPLQWCTSRSISASQKPAKNQPNIQFSQITDT